MTETTITAWHVELVIELDTAKAALSDADKELAAATTAVTAANATHRAVRAALARIATPRSGLAAALTLRLRELSEAEKAAERRRNVVRGAREALQRQVIELKTALTQLEPLIESAAEAA